jgi:hypothetical protein
MVLDTEEGVLKDRVAKDAEKGPLLVENDAASDDREDMIIGKNYLDHTVQSKANNEEMIKKQLDKSELRKVFRPIEQEGIKMVTR